MRKCLITVIVCLFFSFCTFSQDSLQSKSTSENKNNYTNSPLTIIKGDEIRRFPSTNFLDAVNGLFPWVFSQTPDANNFLFVINGYLIQDINGLSLYDIDEVIFSRNNLNGSLYPFSRAGIFYIKTKTTNSHKPVINFNSQYNLEWNKKMNALADVDLPSNYSIENHRMNKPGLFVSNQISLAAGGKKIHFYTSAQLDVMQTPHLYQRRFIKSTGSYADTTNGNLKKKQNNLKAFLNLEYNFSDKLNAGITGNYFHGQTKETFVASSYRPQGFSYFNDSLSGNPLNHYHVGSFINWKPLHNLRNKLFFEYSDNNFSYKKTAESKSYQNDSITSQFITITTTNPYTKPYLLRDQLEYDVLSKGKLRTSVMAIFSYMHDKLLYESNSILTLNGMLYRSSTSRLWAKYKITTLNPIIHFSYNNLFSGYAGYAFILNKGISRYNGSSRSNPYAGFVVDLKNILKIATASRLDLSFHYGNMTENNSNNYWLPAVNPEQFYPSLQFSAGLQFNPSLSYILLKNKLISIQANTTFTNNKISAGAEWNLLELQRLYQIPVTSYYILELGKETQAGLAFYIAAKLIEKQYKHWNMRFNLVFPHSKYEINGVQPPGIVAVKYTLQAGIQNNFQFGDFTIQSNALFGLNRKYYTYSFYQLPVQKRLNEFILNYILFGYELSKSNNQILKNMSIFIHGKNLVSSKKAREYYCYDSYGGAGINLKLK